MPDARVLMGLLHAFVPIWLLVAAGYAARRWRLLGDSAVTVLGWFVFHLAMPAALFVTLARTPLPASMAAPWPPSPRARSW